MHILRFCNSISSYILHCCSWRRAHIFDTFQARNSTCHKSLQPSCKRHSIHPNFWHLLMSSWGYQRTACLSPPYISSTWPIGFDLAVRTALRTIHSQEKPEEAQLGGLGLRIYFYRSFCSFNNCDCPFPRGSRSANAKDRLQLRTKHNTE